MAYSRRTPISMANAEQSREEGGAPNIMTKMYKKISVFECEHGTDMSTLGHGAQMATPIKNTCIANRAEEIKKGPHSGK